MTVEALLAVDCDHRHEQHDPVSDNNGCGRGSDWHKSAMFLCTSSKCAVSVCEACHSVLNARQARSSDCPYNGGRYHSVSGATVPASA